MQAIGIDRTLIFLKKDIFQDWNKFFSFAS